MLADCDPQASLTISLGYTQPDDLPITLSTLIGKALADEPIAPGEGILHHSEGVDLLPVSIDLASMEHRLISAMSRETILRQVLDPLNKQYDHILLDCMPSLALLTLKAKGLMSLYWVIPSQVWRRSALRVWMPSQDK